MKAVIMIKYERPFNAAEMDYLNGIRPEEQDAVLTSHTDNLKSALMQFTKDELWAKDAIVDVQIVKQEDER